MEDQPKTEVRVEKWRLVKWEGEEVETDEPEKHPRCMEIIEGGDDIETRVVYRRA